MRQLLMEPRLWQSMRALAESCAPFEACGLLAGHGEEVREVIPVRNQAMSPTKFRMDPVEQIRAFDRLERDGAELVGIFHSHPLDAGGPFDRPSATDIAESAYPVVQVIWFRSAGTWHANGFWIENGHVTAVELRIRENEQPASG